MNKNIVCTHNGTFNAYDKHWQQAGIDFEYLTDVTKNKLDIGLQYTEQDVRDALNFTGEVSKTHFWNPMGNRNIIWFYAHFRMLYYYIYNSSYDYYWFFDDDVTVADWDTFFKSFENNESDFISYYCFKEEKVNSQINIPIIDDNSYTGNLWFNRFPGHLDRVPDTKDYFGSFFPIVRLSNKALAKLYDINKKGLYGYSEGWVPTILNYNGFTLDTIFDNKSQGKYFDNDKVQVKHKHIKIDWEWL